MRRQEEPWVPDPGGVERSLALECEREMSWEDGLRRSKSELLDDGIVEGLQLEVMTGLGCACGLSS